MYLIWAVILVIVSIMCWQIARKKKCAPWIIWWIQILVVLTILALILVLVWGSPLAHFWLLLVLTILLIVWVVVYLKVCHPHDEVVACSVSVEAIQFNHNTSSATGDALTIRKNFTTPVTLPEWEAGDTQPEESPAAYAILETTGNTVTVKVKFSITPGTVTSAEIRADGGGVLGALDAQTVQFAGGVSTPEFVTFELKNHTIGTGGILREDITWQWKYRCPGQTAWQDADATRHRIYIVLETPKSPWDQTVGSTNNPWTDVLDYSCVWANGQATVVGAAGAVTQNVNASIGLTYDMNFGASKYTSPGNGLNFYCTQFIDYLDNGTGLGNVVNCTDCGTIVTTFSNVLGCDLHASRMQAFFDLTPIKAIGQAGFGCPNWGCGFSYHEVAWTGAGGQTDPIFDACLEVDGDTDPWVAPHTAQLPLNVPFTALPGAPLPIPTPLNANTYRERLCTNNAGGIGSCNATSPWPNSNNGRRIPT